MAHPLGLGELNRESGGVPWNAPPVLEGFLSAGDCRPSNVVLHGLLVELRKRLGAGVGISKARLGVTDLGGVPWHPLPKVAPLIGESLGVLST